MKKGFTLIEMVIAVTITVFILGITTAQFLMQRDHVDMQEKQVKLDRETRLTLVFIGEEMRELGLDPKKTHHFGLLAGNLNDITYRMDRDLDGVVDAADNGNVHLNGDILVFNGNDVLSDVTTLEFRYYDVDGNEIITPPTINEEDFLGSGFFIGSVAMIQAHLITEMTNPRGKTLAHSDQTSRIERKNR